MRSANSQVRACSGSISGWLSVFVWLSLYCEISPEINVGGGAHLLVNPWSFAFPNVLQIPVNGALIIAVSNPKSEQY